MASYRNRAYGIIYNSITGLPTGLYTAGGGVVKTFTGEDCRQDALDEISKVYGNDEFQIVRECERTVTEIIVS